MGDSWSPFMEGGRCSECIESASNELPSGIFDFSTSELIISLLRDSLKGREYKPEKSGILETWRPQGSRIHTSQYTLVKMQI
jgi:hypothetical protein